MGDYVYASCAAYPFDRTALSATPEGTAFLTALDALRSEYTCDVLGDPALTGFDNPVTGLLELGVHEATDGTELFDSYHLSELATAAGLYFNQSDEGHGGYDPLRTCFAPGRLPFTFAYAYHADVPYLRAEDLVRLMHRNANIDDALTAFFTLASMSPSGWALTDRHGQLDALLAQVR